jgi:DNA-binding LacI/PurR family transcriptional regulator
MATVDDVARAAEVAPSTVSRLLNGRMRVRPATEERIRRAVTALGYVPNANARNLAQRRTGVLGLVLPELINPFFAALAECIADSASAHGLKVILCPTKSQRVREESYSDLLASGTMDGLIYVGMFRSNPHLVAAVQGGLPVVIVDEPVADLPPVSCVVVDNYAGGYQATNYLIRLGHRRIAYVSGPSELVTVQERRRGYADALARAGLHADPSLIFEGAYTEQFGISTFSYLLAHADPPTAVFAGNDYIALGLLSAADVHAVPIPHDLSIVGFDDVPFCSYVRPRLTTIQQPVATLAHRSVELLVARLENPDAAPQVDVLPVHLVVRDSACALRPE